MFYLKSAKKQFLSTCANDVEGPFQRIHMECHQTPCDRGNDGVPYVNSFEACFTQPLTTSPDYFIMSVLATRTDNMQPKGCR